MPLTCPHCRIVQAEGNEICINCGQPLTPADPSSDHERPETPEPGHAIVARRASWRLPAAVTACLLFALAASALFVIQRGPALRRALPAQAPPTVPPAATVPPPAPSATALRAVVKEPMGTPAGKEAYLPPLSVTLDSTREGRHVRIGEDVTLTTLVHGRSATLTLFCRRRREKKTMLMFAEGTLCSMTWTPPIAGRYEFTATALDDRRQSATSRRIEITVDAAAPPAESPVASAPPPARAASAPAVTSRATDRPSALTYHVAAAKFPSLRSATVLSDALSRLGYKAVPERMADPHGKTVYVVVTGAYRHPKEARAAALTLQRSGYPAYLFGSR